MNRDFYIPELTPAIARRLTSVMESAKVYIDPKILELAERDRIKDDLSEAVLPIAQFILDHKRRCVLPYEKSVEDIRDAIAYCLPDNRRVIFIDDAINWNRRLRSRITSFKPDSTEQYQFISKLSINPRAMLGLRDCIIVAKTDRDSIFYHPWIGKVFRELILYCEYEHQYVLGNRASIYDNSALVAAFILNPSLNSISISHLFSRGLDKTLPLCSVYNGLVTEKSKKK